MVSSTTLIAWIDQSTTVTSPRVFVPGVQSGSCKTGRPRWCDPYRSPPSSSSHLRDGRMDCYIDKRDAVSDVRPVLTLPDETLSRSDERRTVACRATSPARLQSAIGETASLSDRPMGAFRPRPLIGKLVHVSRWSHEANESRVWSDRSARLRLERAMSERFSR